MKSNHGEEDFPVNRLPKNGSEKLRSIVLRACSFKPEDRFESAEEFYFALDGLIEKHSVANETERSPASTSILDDEDATVGPGWEKKPVADPIPNQEPEEDDATVGPVFAKKRVEDIKPKIQNIATVQRNDEGEQCPKAQEQERKCTGVALPNGFWKCACGRTNAAYVSSCACGINKSDIILVREQPKESQTVSNSSVGRYGSWTCSCGRTNAAYVSSCACGANKRDFEGSSEQMVRTVEKKVVQPAKKQVASSGDIQKKLPDESWKRSEAAHRAWLKSLEKNDD